MMNKKEDNVCAYYVIAESYLHINEIKNDKEAERQTEKERRRRRKEKNLNKIKRKKSLQM